MTQGSGPLQLALLRESIELEARWSREKEQIERQISNLERKLQLKENQLQLVKNNREYNFWSSTFK
jgi:uncharacterized protein YeeX (DUF496 family)